MSASSRSGWVTGGLVAAGIALATNGQGLLQQLPGADKVLRLAQAEPGASDTPAEGTAPSSAASAAPGGMGPLGDLPAKDKPRAGEKSAAPAEGPDGKAAAAELPEMDTERDAQPFTPQAASCTTETLSPAGLAAELRRATKRNAAERERLAREKVAIASLKEELIVARRQLEDTIARKEATEARAAEELAKRKAEEASLEENALKAAAQKAKAGNGAEEQEQGRVVLANAIRNMPPPKAAGLLAALDNDTAGDVLGRLKPKDAGAVLAVMDPERATSLVKYLANGSKGGAR